MSDPDFFESRAIVLSKMGQHKQALQIYVFQLKDYAKAEEYLPPLPLITNTSTNTPRYCNTIFLSTQTPITTPHPQSLEKENSQEPSIYHTLLSLYLTPPSPHAPNWPPALSLLSKHGARLPAATTLDLVPPSLPVRDLESYFKGRMRAANSVLNSERIVARLRGVEKMGVEMSLLLGERVERDPHTPGGLNRRVVVDEDRHCAVCHKRFGGSAIRVWPDGSVVHSGCMRGSVGRGMQERARAW